MFLPIVLVAIFANQTITAFTLVRFLHNFVAGQANYPISMWIIWDPGKF